MFQETAMFCNERIGVGVYNTNNRCRITGITFGDLTLVIPGVNFMTVDVLHILRCP